LFTVRLEEKLMDKPKLVFAPGCFDNFDGTQEELDEMIAEIQAMVEAGTLLENSVPVDEEDEEMFIQAMTSRLNMKRQ
jgi:hypothetical protein